MLISMPTGTSTILGVFQAILDLLLHGNDRLPRPTTIGLPLQPRKQALRDHDLETAPTGSAEQWNR
jgi:hypothetical protein